MTASESLAHQHIGTYSAFLPALETAYEVGHIVVNELLTNWPKYANTEAGVDQSSSPK
jgi:purine nucleoside permease